ncbi:MAG: sugar phosphate isomerase/epimerase [Acidobacteria bacterium]|nr:sugar phosphate isomerase/epimerase [Acidobacteriota bacterium]
MDYAFNRRRFITTAGALLSLNGTTAFSAENSAHSSDIKLGVASYSLRKLSRAQVIAALKELKTPYLNIKEFHLLYDSASTELEAGRKEFEDAGLKIVGGGTISLKEDSDADIRKYFEYAKRSGMPLIVIAPTQQTMPRIERFVREYNIKAAIHNHGPEDQFFPAPQDALKTVKNMDLRVGLCIDVGHTARTGVDVVQSIAEAGSRLLDIHIKDLRSLSDKDSQCRVGEGAMPVVAIFKQLKKMRYQGAVNLEFEIDADSPLPGMIQSFAYMRGVLDGLRG